jgi:pyrroloquinoline quinone biosynthesis protein B
MRIFFVIAFCLLAKGVFSQTPYLIVLGVAQDAGYPHIGCEKSCCEPAWRDKTLKQSVVSLALVDPASEQWWLFEATPDLTQQLHDFNSITESQYSYLPAGIFITHAHIGHYTGLMQLGREALNSNQVPVYVQEKLANFLKTNGPWSQLVSLKNIVVTTMLPDKTIPLTDFVKVTALTVPHRDEFSETSGFRIETNSKKYLFIPDIDKWAKWPRSIVDEVSAVDVALLDATFYTASELPNRDIKEVPHPYVEETIRVFEGKPELQKKIYFIHFNHTNPLLWSDAARSTLRAQGFQVTEKGMILK